MLTAGTIYLLGREDPYASASPLMTALAEHVLDTALALANTSPWGHQPGRETAMADTKTSGQSVRRQARQAAIAAQARQRAKTAERDKLIDTAAINLMVALRERDVLEQHAGVAIRAMLSEGLTLADVVTLYPRRDQPQGSPRLVDLTGEGNQS